MTTTRLVVIPEPPEGSRVVINAREAPIIRGHGSTSYACGRCKAVLVEKVFHGQVRNIVIRCPRCGAYNEVP